MDRAAVTPQRRTHRADTSSAGSLLLPELLARAGHQLAILGGVGALTHSGAIVLNRFPQESFVHFGGGKYFIRQLDRADLLPVQIDYIHVCHLLLLPG